VLQFMPMQPGDVPATAADVTKLRERIGFEPSTSLADGLAAFVRWFLDWKAGRAAGAAGGR
jgi:UDP-glucuronate 4-epimerase